MSLPQHNREVASASNQELASPKRDRNGALSQTASAAVLRRAEKRTRRLARSHYENFLVASILLPRRLRQPFYNVYAFCRTADDLADESGSPQQAIEQLAAFQTKLDETFGGSPPDDLFLALAGTIGRFALPKQPFDDLLDAFRQDQRVFRYADFDQLLDYCRRSANPVGRLVLHLGGCFDAENAALSDEICTGLQLANFWQDVARDLAIGRVYLPADEMAKFGVSESMLTQPSASAELRRLLASECDRAEGFFRRGLPLAQQVPSWLSGDIKLFAHGGLETLRAIRRIDYDVLRTRPRVSKWKQSWLLIRALLRLL